MYDLPNSYLQAKLLDILWTPRVILQNLLWSFSKSKQSIFLTIIIAYPQIVFPQGVKKGMVKYFWKRALLHEKGTFMHALPCRRHFGNGAFLQQEHTYVLLCCSPFSSTTFFSLPLYLFSPTPNILLRNRRLYLPRTSSVGSLKLWPFQLKSRCRIPSNPRLGAQVCRERMHLVESVNTIITVHRGRIRLASPGDNWAAQNATLSLKGHDYRLKQKLD